MEQTVNERIMLLKSHLKLGRNDFATKANISLSTHDNILNGGEMKPKTIKTICAALNANPEWVLTGNGEMFNTETADAISGPSLWQDATYKKMQAHIDSLEAEVKRAWAVASHFSGGKLNFLKPSKRAGSAQVITIPTESLKVA